MGLRDFVITKNSMFLKFGSAEPQPLNRLHFPVVTLDAPRPTVAARGTDPTLGVISAPPASPATDMHYLVTLAH